MMTIAQRVSKRIYRTIAFLFGSMMLLQGCTYSISKDLVNKTDKAVTFEMLQADPDLYKGRIIILGGSIAAVRSMREGSLIYIYESPLDYWGKPIRKNGVRGLFLVYTGMFIDPNIYTPGNQITVAGEIEGTTLQLPGYTELTRYSYPVLISKELKLWSGKPSPMEPQWWDPLWNPSSPMLSPVR